MTEERALAQGKVAWEQLGQFTMPEVGKDHPQGRAVLYLAGYQAGYAMGVAAGRAQALAEQEAATNEHFQKLDEERRRAGNEW